MHFILFSQITRFLQECSRSSETGGDESGSRLCLELLLALAVHRGSLAAVLEWAHTALKVQQVSMK